MCHVKQKDPTGCGIACTAMLTKGKVSYDQVKAIGLFDDRGKRHTIDLDRDELRELLKAYDITLGRMTRFTTLPNLPPVAILATKWRKDGGREYWHWVVYHSADGEGVVLDPNNALKNGVRTDFGRMKPNWYHKITLP